MKRTVPPALRKLREEIAAGLCDPACAVSRLIVICEAQATAIRRLEKRSLKTAERARRAVARADARATEAAAWWERRFIELRKESKR